MTRITNQGHTPNSPQKAPTRRIQSAALSLFGIVVCTFIAGIISNSAYSQEIRYVSDVTFVPIRSGQGKEFRILNAGLKSGTALTLLATSDDDLWSQVRTPGGTVGWIRNQYLMQNKPARLQLTALKTELANLREQNIELVANNKALTANNNQLNSTAEKASGSRAQMADELKKIKKLSAGAIQLERNYQTLLTQQQLLKTELQTIRAENENLKKDHRLNFLFYGAGILFFGMILAVVVPAMKPKKRYSEWR